MCVNDTALCAVEHIALGGKPRDHIRYTYREQITVRGGDIGSRYDTS